MTRICWWLVTVVARMLEPEERDVVLGDFGESGEPAGQALLGVLGLVIRRQLALWKRWEPWLAVLGIAGVVGLRLSEVVFHFDVAVRSRLRDFNNLGLTDEEYIAYFVCLSLGLFLWSWAGGFVLGALSGRARWLTGALFYVVVIDSYLLRLVVNGNIVFRHPAISKIAVLFRILAPFQIGAFFLFLVPLVWGVYEGHRRRTLGFLPTLILSTATTILTGLATLVNGWGWQKLSLETRLWPFVLLSWPIAYMLAAASWRRWHNRNASHPASHHP